MLSLSSVWDFFTLDALYIQLKHSWILVKRIGTGLYFEHDTTVVMQGEKIIGFADDSFSPLRIKMEDLKICNGFDHPRTLLHNFTVAEATLRYFIARVYRKRFKRPFILFHVYEELDGELTDIELKAISDLCICVGASRVLVSTRPQEFCDEELLPPNEKHWIDPRILFTKKKS